jgi:hypothetical protein
MFQFCCGIISGIFGLLMFMFSMRIFYDGLVDASLLDINDIPLFVENVQMFFKDLFKKEVVTNVYYPFI